MGGKFINKSYVNAIDTLTKGTIDRVQNANYIYNNHKPVVSTWFNMNKEGTTFDEATRAEYVQLGKLSPIKFNQISDAVFYSSGIKIELDVDYNEEGLGVNNLPNIGGIVLPNTWIPYAGDYFIINHMQKDWLYKVTAVSFDTIDNGNNIYRFEASLDQMDSSQLRSQVVSKYKMVINNVGTSYNAVITEEVYNSVETIDTILDSLKNYYIALFYNERVQTFTYQGYYGKLYDPYMIEFIMRNNLLEGSSQYIYAQHEVPVPKTFCIDYNQTYFRALENKSLDLFNNNFCSASLIDNQYSLFSCVMDDYFMISYSGLGIQKFQTLDSELISRVKENKEYTDGEPESYYNIIIRYFNSGNIGNDIVSYLEDIKFEPTSKLFYAIPMIIYILEKNVENLMS